MDFKGIGGRVRSDLNAGTNSINMIENRQI
jgi:hypothetical protein